MERLEGKTRYDQKDLQKFLDEGVEVLSNTPLATVPDRRFKIHRGQQGELFLRELLEDGVGLRTMDVPDAEGQAMHDCEAAIGLRKTYSDKELEHLLKAGVTEIEDVDGTVWRIVRYDLVDDPKITLCLRNVEPGLRRTTMTIFPKDPLFQNPLSLPTNEEAEALHRVHDRERTSLDPTKAHKGTEHTQLLIDRIHHQTKQATRDLTEHTMKETEAMIRDVMKELDAARKELADLKRHRNRTAREMNELQRNYAELKKTEDGLSERLALTSKDLEMWRERARAAESTVTELDIETVRLKSELRETRENAHTLINEAREERDKAQWERKRMQDALDLQTRRVGELETKPEPEPEAPMTHADLILRTGSMLAEAATKLMEASTMWARRAQNL